MMNILHYCHHHGGPRGEEAAREIGHLRDELSAAIGYMMNAKIDLETGCTKATAIATISGGIKRARAALDAASQEPSQ